MQVSKSRETDNNAPTLRISSGMIIGQVPVFIVTVMFILNFVHCEITACHSDNDEQSLSLSYLIISQADAAPCGLRELWFF